MIAKVVAMTYAEDKWSQTKISPEFAARLARLAPDQKVRVIVLLNTRSARAGNTARQGRAERRAAIGVMRTAAAQAMEDVDNIIQQFDGQLHASVPDALGSIPVETSAAGIEALAASPWVKAILEDQPIFAN